MKTIKNIIYNSSYQILLMIIPLITQPYVSRVLLPHANGIYTATFNTMQYFIILGDLGIGLYANREIAYHRDNPFDRSKIFWEIELLQLFTTGISFICFLIYIAWNNEYLTIQLLQLLWLLSYSFDISWYFMALEDFQKTVTKNTVVKVISIILIFILVKSPSDLIKYTIIQGGAQFIGALSLWSYLPKTLVKVHIKHLNFLKHLKPSFILFIPNVAVQVYSILNKSMLQHLVNVSSVAFFTFGDNIVRTVLALVTATGSVMLPKIANRFAKGNMKGVKLSLYRNMNFVSAISFPLMFGLAAIGTKFAIKFFGPQYIASGPVIVRESPILVLIAWSTVIGRQYLMPINKMTAYTLSVTLGAICNIIINIPLIHIFGTSGTALATTISELVVTAYQVLRVRKELSIKKMFKGQWKYFICGLIMYLIVHALSNHWPITVSHIILEIFVGIILYAFGMFITKAQIIYEFSNVIKLIFKKGDL
ncbi:MAG: polysaccharide biosynthesis C-terminal domain-containing protein [Firmicutes bacterium]|uniref:Polysaccharide biosynthesis C-terminal domain-containing protein n=1 Tax=Candidatus Gallilactobacillus intestinavium TaxID=2840838 RepID=A0A9D9H8B0_9LACO|nr:polysaccharide biosynthesis C-terminal domain-containing protein [Candidatus Gallilactobacillus intestinavium]